MSGTVASLDLDPYAPEWLRDPYPFHEILREAGPVVRLERYGVWALGRYEHVRSTLNDWKTFCSSAGVGLSNFIEDTPWRTPSLLLETDPPIHTRYRDIITRVLSRQSLKSLRPSFETEADKLIEQLIGLGSFDAARDLAQVFPLKVFPDAVGVDDNGREHLLTYGDMAFNAFGPRNALLQEAMTKVEPVGAYVAARCKRDALQKDRFGHQIFREVDSGKVSESDASLLVRSLLTAGVDTTVSALSSAILLLARNPDQWQLLRDDPGLARSAFEEAVRCESPVQTFFRTTTADAVIDGVAIPAGQKVLMFLGAANRDPRRWPDPERFDIRRNTTGHVGFGGGIHGCVGQLIARLEGEIVLSRLACRVSSIELTGEPAVHLNDTLRGWSTVPVRVRVAA
jgi:4-methoxybenzoate monooxygenase (O-demethylating)